MTLLSAELAVTVDAVRELIRLGAVAIDGVRVDGDVSVRTGTRVTAYPQPRRFPDAFGDWCIHPIVDRNEFAIFAKPHGVPTVATADNGIENALAALDQAHGRRFALTHRLDTGAAGLLVVAKSPNAQAVLDEVFRERRIAKHYRVLAPAGLALGTYTHWLSLGAPPRKAAVTAQEGWEQAELVVESAEPFAADKYPKGLAEYGVRLITGRTHQIRAQFTALGFPMVGDKSYGGKGSMPRPYPRGSLALVATGLRFDDEVWGTVTAEIAPTWRT